MQAWPRATYGFAMCLLCMDRYVRVGARANGVDSRGCHAEEVSFVAGCPSQYKLGLVPKAVHIPGDARAWLVVATRPHWRAHSPAPSRRSFACAGRR